MKRIANSIKTSMKTNDYVNDLIKTQNSTKNVYYRELTLPNHKMDYFSNFHIQNFVYERLNKLSENYKYGTETKLLKSLNLNNPNLNDVKMSNLTISHLTRIINNIEEITGYDKKSPIIAIKDGLVVDVNETFDSNYVHVAKVQDIITRITYNMYVIPNVNCKNCLDCFGCVDCVNCVNCINCTDCRDCKNCIDNIGCRYMDNCMDCHASSNCTDSVSCIASTNFYYSMGSKAKEGQYFD